jgi:hypothetical protein
MPTCGISLSNRFGGVTQLKLQLVKPPTISNLLNIEPTGTNQEPAPRRIVKLQAHASLLGSVGIIEVADSIWTNERHGPGLDPYRGSRAAFKRFWLKLLTCTSLKPQFDMGVAIVRFAQ